MARGRLEVRGSTFEALFHELSTVKNEFEHADRNSGQAADAVGHPGLASKVRSFSSNWDNHRDDLLKAIGDLGKVAEGIDNGFDEVEQELASHLHSGRGN